MNAFDRFAPFVQDFIYANGWESLRSIQVAAADAIFNTNENVLLTASTASGKTEAAFFPILTLFSEDPPASVGALYIGPLKALINDQFYRLNDLCDQADIPVWHWHGDVAASHKRKLLQNPSGILQITPESLEALLLHKHSAISIVVVRHSASSSASPPWRASIRGVSAFPPRWATPSARAISWLRAPDEAPSSPALMSRAAPGGSPWTTFTLQAHRPQSALLSRQTLNPPRSYRSKRCPRVPPR